MAFAQQTLILLCLFVANLVWAQGDFAPYEDPEKLKKATIEITDESGGGDKEAGSSAETTKKTAPKSSATTKNSSAKKTAKTKAKPKSQSQRAIVTVDGAAVYEMPNFDSPILEYLDQGKKVLVAKKLTPGLGGLGAFYKVRIGKGQFGYITDVDIRIEGKKSAKDDGAGEKETKGGGGIFGGGGEDSADPTDISSEMMSDNPLEDENAESGYLVRWVGIGYSGLNYTETIAKTRKTAQTPMFGIKYSGPTSYLGGMPLDLDFLFTTTAPSFYDEFASSTSGFMLVGNAAAMIPLAEFSKGMIYYGLGLSLKYTKWSVKLIEYPTKPALDSQEFTVGAIGLLGAAWQIGQKFMLRADGKYYYENEKYFGFGVSAQYKY